MPATSGRLVSWKVITRSGYGKSVMLSVHILMYDTKSNDVMTMRLGMVGCLARPDYIEYV